MASISGSSIPVVPRVNATFRKRDILITQAYSDNDTVGGKVVADPALQRHLGSGSIVREGVVTYYPILDYGVTMGGRTNITDRIPSAGLDATRQVVVDMADNQTIATLVTALSGDLPQTAFRHLGTTIARGQAVGDIVVTRVSNSGLLG